MPHPPSRLISPAFLQSDYPRVRFVGSFAELKAMSFGHGVNALCWPRSLEGNFGEIVVQVGPCEEITSLDEARLLALVLSPAGCAARDILIDDLRLLREAGLAPSLEVIPAYPRDEGSSPVPTDVYSFHADSAPVIADTYLCSYTVAASEGIRNEEAVRRVDIPATRAALLAEYGGVDDDEFQAYLAENCFDLHYLPVEGAIPFNFGLGNLWRIANACPGSPVPPCIHRAPTTMPGQPPRLLLIS